MRRGNVPYDVMCRNKSILAMIYGLWAVFVIHLGCEESGSMDDGCSNSASRSLEEWIVTSEPLDMRLILVLKEVHLETFQNIYNSELNECFANAFG